METASTICVKKKAFQSCHMTSALSLLSGLSRAFQEVHNLEYTFDNMHTFPRMITIVFVKGLGTSLIAFIRFSEIALLFSVSVTQKCYLLSHELKLCQADLVTLSRQVVQESHSVSHARNLISCTNQ